MIDVYILEVSSSQMCDTIFYELSGRISYEKMKRIRKMQHDIDKKLCLYADILVRIQATKALCIKNSSIVIQKNQYGKPYLLSHSDFQYNITHTRNAIAIAFSDAPVGIDIEKIQTPSLQIAQRFFTADEYRYIISSNDIDKRFFEVWTKKEAYLKCLGQGLTIPLNSFSVLMDSSKYYIYHFHEYVIAAHREDLNKEVVVHHLDEEGFYEQAYLLDRINFQNN